MHTAYDNHTASTCSSVSQLITNQTAITPSVCQSNPHHSISLPIKQPSIHQSANQTATRGSYQTVCVCVCVCVCNINPFIPFQYTLCVCVCVCVCLCVCVCVCVRERESVCVSACV